MVIFSWVKDKIEYELSDIQRLRPVQMVIRRLSLHSLNLGSSLPTLDVDNVDTALTADGKLEVYLH